MKEKIVIFSGAGMSAESGINTFRDSNGLWEQYDISEVATPEAWNKNPDLVTDFYNQRRKQIFKTSVNEAHKDISSLERIFDVTVITQNIDNLHERAGSSKVVHLHGNIAFAKSSGPSQEKKYYPLSEWELKKTDLCDDGYRLRPHVVWFGEEVPMMTTAQKVIESADYFIVIGTSLEVYPAAGLIHFAHNAKKRIIIDPNAESMNLPTDFIRINQTATLGVKKAKEILID